jgi:hypothetical protein
MQDAPKTVLVAVTDPTDEKTDRMSTVKAVSVTDMKHNFFRLIRSKRVVLIR